MSRTPDLSIRTVRIITMLVTLRAALAWLPDVTAQELRRLPREVFPNRPLLAPGERLVDEGEAISSERPASADKLIEVLQFDAVPLAEAMQSLSKEVGLNIVTSEAAGVQPITVYLENVTAIDAVEAIVKANGLFYRIDARSGIVRIATKEEYVSDLSSFREEETRVFTLLYPNPDAVARAISQVYGDRVQLASADDGFGDLIELTQRFNRFDLVDGRALGLGTFGGGLGGIGGGLGGIGGGMGGIGGGLGGGIGGFGGLTGRSRSRIDVAAEAVDRQAQERELVEDLIQELENARASERELSEEQRAELQRRTQATIFISTIRRNNQVVVRTGDPQTMEQIAQLIAQLDVPTPTVLLEVKVLRVELADGFNSAFEYFAGDRGEAFAFSDGPQLAAPPGQRVPRRHRCHAAVGRRFGGRRRGTRCLDVPSDRRQLSLSDAVARKQKSRHGAGHALDPDRQQRSQPHLRRRHLALHRRLYPRPSCRRTEQRGLGSSDTGHRTS